MIAHLSVMLCAVRFVFGSSEEVDKLRTTWRISGEEKSEIYTDIWRLKEEVKNEKETSGYLIGLKEQLMALKTEQQEFLAAHEEVPKEKEKILEEFEAIKKEADDKLKATKARLILNETEMETLWDDETFIAAFDYILSNSLLTPTPRFPSVYDSDEKLIKKAMDQRNEFLTLESAILAKKTDKLKKINENVAQIQETLGRFNLLEAARFKLEMMKLRLKGLKIDEERITKLLKHVEVFEKHQSNEIAVLEKKHLSDSITRLKQYSDLMFSGDGQWRLRLGPVKERNVLDGKKLDIAPLVNNAIAENSKLASESKTKREEFIKQIKLDDAEKMKFVKMIGSNEIYEFMMRKCVRVIEGIHRYLVERGDAKPLGFYQEAIADLIPKEDL